VIKPLEALTSEGAEAQMRVLAQSWILPNVFNVGNVVKQLIWTRMTKDGGWIAQSCKLSRPFPAVPHFRTTLLDPSTNNWRVIVLWERGGRKACCIALMVHRMEPFQWGSDHGRGGQSLRHR
jgi:hypothetical protein